MKKHNNEGGLPTPIMDEKTKETVNNIRNSKKNFLKAQKDGQEVHTKLVETLNKENTNLKKDMEENPDKYLKKVMMEFNKVKKLLAQKIIELRTFEGNSLRAVAGLHKELEDKDSEIETLKGVVSQINFITDGFVDRNEKN